MQVLEDERERPRRGKMLDHANEGFEEAVDVFTATRPLGDGRPELR